jgi:hypothetical protein
MDAVLLQSFLDQIKQWKAQGLADSKIQSRLEQMQLTEEQVTTILQEWKRIRTSKKRDAGFIYAGVGGTIMLVSFILSFFLFQQGQNFMIVLYTFTFIGIGIVFKGLIDILGW